MVTPQHVRIMKHALGWPKLYRNHYAAGADHDNYKQLAELVIWGYMDRQLNKLDEMSESYIFTVTDAGVEWMKQHHPTCLWAEDPDGVWGTECGEMFQFNDGGPLGNNFGFCPYCGHALREERYDD